MVVLFDLESIVATNNIVQDSFVEVFKESFNISPRLSGYRYSGFNQLFEESKFDTYILNRNIISSDKIQVQKKIKTEKQKFRDKVNLKIDAKLETFSVLDHTMAIIKSLQAQSFSLGLYSHLDGHLTFKLIKKLSLSSYFNIIYSRSDLVSPPPDDEVLQMFRAFFDDKGEVKIYRSSHYLLESNQQLNKPCELYTSS
ncbi:MAG: HAD hydrolase-like protein [Bacteriovoracaceae bacterium]|jgi:beta-phosphoglucomutase-like phosphatase (HAD superfamily)|nr:hypothetical protein [Halobacteriovoraceae bacterium]MDP7321864.1 HAD hydrolase-like protein [Bacteriovoracaceae bacterium]